MGIHWSKIAWGDAPTWFTGVLTGAAVLLTAIGLWLETGRSRRDRAARTEAEKHRQAELVAAWEDHLSLDPADYITALQAWRGDQPGDTSAVGAIVFIRIRNASELPVYSLRYRVFAGVRGTFVGDLAVLPPGTVAEVALPLTSPPRGGGSSAGDRVHGHRESSMDSRGRGCACGG